jgi:hypothetical protein
MRTDDRPAPLYTVGDVATMARAVADSGLFGMDQAQAMTLMLLAQSEGVDPIQALRRYQVLRGRPGVAADAMLADFQAAVAAEAEPGRGTAQAATAPAAAPARRVKTDPRPLHRLVADGVDQVNAQFAADVPDAEPVLNRFEAHRHLLKAAVALGYLPDPGTIAQRQVHALLAALYQESRERRNWLRRELAAYLTRRLAEARAREPARVGPTPGEDG